MYIADLFENYIAEAGPQLVVIYPGRFQPFHLGHGEVFQDLQRKFGRDNVYIATSNKTELPKSPFNFSDKVQLMNAAGIPSDRIIQVSDPYRTVDYVSALNLNLANTIMIFALGAPDAQRLAIDTVYTEFTPTGKKSKIPPGKSVGSPRPFKSFTKLQDCVTADQHQYVIIENERHKVITLGNSTVDVSHGTPARAAWNVVRNDPQLRSQYLLQMYGRDDPEIGRILDKIPPSATPEPAPTPKPTPATNTVAEEAGGVGVIANKKQAKDPRYSMSLTKDIRPGEVGRQLKKMHLADSVQQLREQIATLKEKWSAKYKRSINCNSPRGFSQRAHCQGRKK